MTTVTDRNRSIRKNGRAGERAAITWLRQLSPSLYIQVVNELLDLVVRDRYVEIKTCNASITASQPPYHRVGRYTLRKDQHTILTETDGYYLFVVLYNRQKSTVFLVAARDLPYHRQIAWSVAWRYRKDPAVLLQGDD